MGFTTGFTGGVTLTLTLAYLSVRAHQRNREQQGQSLRYQAFALQNLVDPIAEPLPPTRSEAAAAQRAQSIEVAKDRWNQEVENAVRWVQHTDWDEVRESIEAGIARAWTKAFGEAAEGAEAAKVELKPVGQQAKALAEEKSRSIATAARGAFAKAKSEEQKTEALAHEKGRDVRLKAQQEVAKAEDVVKGKTGAAKGLIASALDKGKGMAQGMVDKAKTSVGAAEDRLEAKVSSDLASDPVKKALLQRYEKPEAKHNQTVAEALKERYTPMDQRDNTVLRGL